MSNGNESRQIPIEEFLQGYYETDLGDNEFITDAIVQKPGRDVTGTYLKHQYYSEVNWPCVDVVAFATSSMTRLKASVSC